MAATSSTPPLPPLASQHHGSRLPAWAREPLLHFAVLGALLFAVDHVIAGRADDPRTILITAEVDDEARALFKTRRGRDPNREELAALRQVWLDNEVLYREGLALQVDRGDSAIRDRVIFKALSVVDASVKPPPLDEPTLRAWFEANRAKYDEPPRYDFQEAVLYGDTSEAAVREFAEALNKGTPGDAQAGLRVFKGRPRANVAETYGAGFAKALDEAPIGRWRPYETGKTWRAIRLEAITAAKAASFEELRGIALHDWIDAKMAESRTAAVRALGRKYAVRYEAAAQ